MNRLYDLYSSWCSTLNFILVILHDKIWNTKQIMAILKWLLQHSTAVHMNPLLLNLRFTLRNFESFLQGFAFLQKLWTVTNRQKPQQPLLGHYGLYMDDIQAVLTLEDLDSCCYMALRLTLAFVSCRVVEFLHLTASGSKKWPLFIAVSSEIDLATVCQRSKPLLVLKLNSLLRTKL